MSTENTFSLLEQSILKAKGLTPEHLSFLNSAGVASKGDFGTIGTTATLLEIMPDLDAGVAAKVMEWAVGHSASLAPEPVVVAAGPSKVVLDSADVTYCVHCQSRQPRDYKTGDLCPTCGKQAEPVQSCYWCGQSGPGKFCRGCGAEFVPLAEFDLAVLLKREGIPKEDIAKRLTMATPAEKDILWGRVRRVRG